MQSKSVSPAPARRWSRWRPNPFRPDVAVAIDDVIDPTLDALNAKKNDLLVRSKLFPRIAPLYYPRAGVYGATAVWNF